MALAIVVLLGGCDAVLHLDPPGNPPTTESAGVFVAMNSSNRASMSFKAHAHAAGDAIVLQLGCHATSTNTATMATIDAPGWTWNVLDAITFNDKLAVVSYGAIAPDSAEATFTVTWSGSLIGPCTETQSAIGDDFTNAKHSLAFDGHFTFPSQGDCIGSIDLGFQGEAVWAACNAFADVKSVDAPFMRSANDGHGNDTAYRLTSDPPQSKESVRFSAGNDDSILELVTIAEQ